VKVTVTDANGNATVVDLSAMPDLDTVAFPISVELKVRKETEQGEQEETGPDAQNMLEALEGEDSKLALEAVRQASTRSVNAVDDIGRGALLLAAMEGHLGACHALLARLDFHGANARDMIGSTALHMAAGNDHVEICRLLLASTRFTAGANALNNNQKTPLDFAIEFGEGQAADVIQAAGGVSGGRAPRTEGNLRDRMAKRVESINEASEGVENVNDMNDLD